MNIGVHVFFEWKLCLDICPGMGLLGHMIILYLAFWGTSILFVFHSGCTTLHSHQQCRRGYLFSTPSPPFVIHRLINDSHSYLCQVVPYYIFDLHFSNNCDVEHFSCACQPSECLLWRNVCLGFLPIFHLGCLLFCCWIVWVVCIFWDKALIGCIVYNYFLPFHKLSFFFFLNGFLCFSKSCQFI